MPISSHLGRVIQPKPSSMVIWRSCFFKAVGVDTGQGGDQGGLAVVHVAGGADDVQGVSLL